jgi:hypothetical protein
MPDKVQVDLPPVSQENAVTLVVHHLALAMGYFQALPEGGEREALAVQIKEHLYGFPLERGVAGTFVDALCDQYECLAAAVEGDRDHEPLAAGPGNG